MRANSIYLRILVFCPLLLAGLPSAHGGWFDDLWRTRDQQAQRAFDNGDYATAAKMFTDPLRRGTAQFEDGEFKAAAASFGRVNSAEGAYNYGNALIMQGKYKEAIAAFDRALGWKNYEWEAAITNRKIAEIRAKRQEDAGENRGDPTEIGADEIVFDENGKKNQGADDVVDEEAGAGDQMSDKEIQAMWLRRVQTKPADFLRSKFSYQYARQQAQSGANGEEKGKE